MIKVNSINDRVFKLLGQNNNEQFIRLLIHTEIRLPTRAFVYLDLLNSIVL